MMNRGHYKLVGKKVVPCTLGEWAEFFERRSDRILKQDKVGKLLVSTVFLGLDHNFGNGGKPIVFESMVLGPHTNDDNSVTTSHDYACERYTTYDEALAGHAVLLGRVLSGEIGIE